MNRPRYKGQYLSRPLADRMEERIERIPFMSCWYWNGSTRKQYAQININGKSKQATRALYEAEKGSIPDGYEIDHLCRNRWCVNPAHLEAVTKLVNVRRGIAARNAAREVPKETSGKLLGG